MNSEQYKKVRKKEYKKFANYVKRQLEILIKSYKPYKFHLLQIQARAKDSKSLDKKIANLSKIDRENLQDIIKDLAGCRVLFYHLNDADEFENSNIISKNFKVIPTEYKMHHPVDSNLIPNNSDYRAVHYIIELQENHEQYSKFEGMKCEIQIQILLHHIYSETAHDTIYKRPNTHRYGQKSLEDIEKNLKNTMDHHLVKAGYELQSIQDKYEKLRRSMDFLEKNPNKKVKKTKDNNQLYIILEKYRDSLEYYNDINEKLNMAISIVTQSLNLSRNFKVVSSEVSNFIIPGITFDAIFDRCLDILSCIQYIDIAQTFSTLLDLYTKYDDETSKNKMLDFVSVLSNYNILILDKHGLKVQNTLLKIVEDWEPNTLKKFKSIAIRICNSAFDFETRHVLSTFEGVKDRKCLLSITNKLVDVRQRAIKILCNVYNFCLTFTEKIEVLKTLEESTQTPYNFEYGDNLLIVVLENSQEVICFYKTLIRNKEYSVLSEMEKHVNSLLERSYAIQKQAKNWKNKQDKNQELIINASDFIDALNNDKHFIEYKKLVNLIPANYVQIQELTNSIDMKIYIDWEKIIDQCLETLNSNPRQEDCFKKFLELVTKKDPDFILGLLDQKDKLSKFVCPILCGLYQNDQKLFFNHVDKHIEQGTDLSQIIEALLLLSEFDKLRLQSIIDKALTIEDVSALYSIIRMILHFFDIENEALLKDLKEMFLNVINKIKNLKQIFWVNNIIMYQENYSFLVKRLTENEVTIILGNLMNVLSIDCNVENALLPIAERFPELIIEFFGSRIDIKKENPYDEYQDLPFYNMYRLRDVLSQDAEQIIRILKSWFDKNFNSRGKLLVKIYPDFSLSIKNIFNQYLNERSDNNNNVEFVLACLKNYYEQPFVYEICKEIVMILPQESNKLEEVENIILNNGVIRHEFPIEYGMRDSYVEKIKIINSWFYDPNTNVKEFANKLLKKLYNKTKEYQRNGEEIMELEKIEYSN